jgi:hypothetical protein
MVPAVLVGVSDTGAAWWLHAPRSSDASPLVVTAPKSAIRGLRVI